jgi:hypothetical protein
VNPVTSRVACTVRSAHLTISAGIAAAHRAKLLPSNLPGGGALFTVEFPVATQGGLLGEVRDLGMNARA